MTAESLQWDLWFAAARRAEVDDALRDLFRAMNADIAARKPVCDLSGRCCRFDTWGHQLYATGLEIAWLLTQLDDSGRSRLRDAPLPQMDGCPFQVGKLCSVHTLRPIGCRVYYCDPNAQDWQGEVYERFLGELKQLHTRFAVEYRYMEWRRGLAEARDASTLLS